MLENRKSESGELRCISKAEFYSLSLKQVVKKQAFILIFKNPVTHPQHTQVRVLCTRLHLEFSLVGIVTTIGSILILIPHSNAFYSFRVWNAVWAGVRTL